MGCFCAWLLQQLLAMVKTGEFSSKLRIWAALGMLVTWVFVGCQPEEGEANRCDTGSARQAVSVGRCEGRATSCRSLSPLSCVQDGCDVDIGAYDNPYDDECEGRADDCSEMTTETQCGYQKGCRWVVGEEKSNSESEQSDCDEAEGTGGSEGVPTTGGGATAENPSGGSDGGSTSGGDGQPAPAPEP